jgi:hypothetical protein
MKTPALVWCLVWLASMASVARAQAPAAPTLNCPTDIGALHLYGQWQLTLTPLEQGAPTVGTLDFERHPDYADTVRGRWQSHTGGPVHLLSGDITDGELVLDESIDGVQISAVWVGFPVACGQRFEGERRPASMIDGVPQAQQMRRFELKKQDAWR